MTVPQQRFGEEAHPSGCGAPAAPAKPHQRHAPAAAAAPPQPSGGPPPSAFAQHLSQEGVARQQGTLRKLASQFMGVPGVVSLSGGFPPAELFPLEGLTLTLRGGQTVTIDDPATVATAQQYNLALRGYAPLVRWVEAHVAALHAPPGLHEVAVTNGGNHTVEMLVSLLLERGDSILMEEYSYPHMLECVAAPKGLLVIPLPMDSEGIIPEAMEQVLERLRANPGPIPFPKVLYTIPTAQNPTGATITPQRRAAVYELCCRHDILIIEDDPYFYLQFPSGPAPGTPDLGMTSSGSCSTALGALGLAASADFSPAPSVARCGSGMSLCASGLGAASSRTLSLDSASAGTGSGGSSPLAAGAPPAAAAASSYLSLDREGRVARVDSFAKFLSPGLRLGWVSAPPDILDKLVMCLQAHTVGPCSLSQVVVAETLGAWGEAGLAAHLQSVREGYARKAAVVMEAAEQELAGLAEWAPPTGGMFLWLRLLGVGDATEVWEELQRHKVVVIPGRAMHPRAGDPDFKCPYVRLSFSYASEEQLREGVRRLGAVLRAHAAGAAGGCNGGA